MTSKLLMIVDLEHTLCFSRQRGEVYTIHSSALASNFLVRPGLDSLLRFAFVKNRVRVKVGVWANESEKSIKEKVEKLFGKYHSNLLFLYPDNKPERDLRRVWFNFQDFSVNNTVFITGNECSVPKDQQTSLIQLPAYRGQEDDVGLQIVEGYFGFYLDKHIGQKIKTIPQLSMNMGWKQFLTSYIGPDGVEDLSGSRFKT